MHHLLILCVISLVCAGQTLSNQHLPVEYKGAVKPANHGGKPFVFSSDCFTMNKATLYASPEGGELILDAQMPTSFFCADFYLFVSGTQYFIHTCEMRGIHRWKIKNWQTDKIDAYEDVLQYGLAIFRLDINLLKDIRFIWDIYNAFKREDPKAIRTFLEKYAQHEFVRREQPYSLVPEHLIHSGDALSILKMNTEEAGICYGSGSRAGHSAFFIRNPYTKQLYVAETNPSFGINKFEYETWVELHANGTLCHAETCSAVWLPIRRDWVKYIDEYKLWEWFTEREGWEYCYHGNFFAPIDSTEHPFPYPINGTYFGLLFGYLIERATPAGAKEMLYGAFEQRIHTKVESFEDVVIWARDHNKTVVDLFVIPEQDDWRYPMKSSNPDHLMVDSRECLQCTNLVVKAWKVSGLFDGVFGEGFSSKVNAAEFHPRDLYQIQLFEPIKPDVCQTDSYPFCHILGHYLLDLIGVNSVKPHAHINEKCGLVWPDFKRTPEVC
ncbi:hypothetical protein GEMRC1_007833 [Eukaryota sp. GEM-RC1]